MVKCTLFFPGNIFSIQIGLNVILCACILFIYIRQQIINILIAFQGSSNKYKSIFNVTKKCDCELGICNNFKTRTGTNRPNLGRMPQTS